MTIRFFYFLTLTTLLIFSCKSTDKLTQTRSTPQGVDPALEEAKRKALSFNDTTSVVLIDTITQSSTYILASIKKTACYGKCPAFEAKLFSNGILLYEGREHTELLGLHEAYLEQEQIDELIARATEADFFDLATFYPEEGKKLADLPETHTYLKIGDREKEIVNNHNAPLGLRQFEQYFNDLIEELEWSPIRALPAN